MFNGGLSMESPQVYNLVRLSLPEPTSCWLQIQLDEAETNAIKWGRKMAAKMEARCRELEAELDAEQRRSGDAHKNLRKAERGIKEYTFRLAYFSITYYTFW